MCLVNSSNTRSLVMKIANFLSHYIGINVRVVIPDSCGKDYEVLTLTKPLKYDPKTL